jgi:hypothetical protein
VYDSIQGQPEVHHKFHGDAQEVRGLWGLGFGFWVLGFVLEVARR